MQRDNQILDALDSTQRQELRALGTMVPLVHRAILTEPDEPLTHILFPVSGAISLVTVMRDGESVEAGLIGHEGLLGPVGPLAERIIPWRAVVQMPGEALAVPVSALATHAELVAALQPLERRLQTSLHWLATLSIACSRFHTLDQRCARWLLMLHDRADGDTVQTTHEFLGEMLGAQRQSVSRTLTRLEKAGLIAREHRSEVRIVDRAALERAACECYERMERLRAPAVVSRRSAGASRRPHHATVEVRLPGQKPQALE